MSRWDGFEEVVAIADAGGFARAAALLGVSTSHVSKTVARLEQRLAAQLFYRTTRRVTLTETGRAFVDHGRRLIHERDELLLMMAGTAELHGHLRITCSTALGERFIARIVREFAVANPRISVSLDLTNRLVDIVSEGYDLAVRTGRLADPRLTGRQIALRPIETCASPHYLQARGAPAAVRDLDNHDCLIGTNPAWRFADGGETIDYRPQGRWRCNSGAATVDAAVASLGICQLPRFYVGPALRTGHLVPILEACRPAAEPIWAVYPARRHLSPKIRTLVAVLERDLQPGIDDLLQDNPTTGVSAPAASPACTRSAMSKPVPE